MKKYLTTLAICLLSLTLVLSGCGFTPLTNSPTATSKTIVNGSALVYDDYIYFANSFVSASDIKKSDDNSNVENPAIYRIKTTDGKISYDEDTKLPTTHEKAVAKIAGSDYAYTFSSGKYIYFASPNIHKDANQAVLSSYNSYFRVNTDGSDLVEFYSSNSSVTQQTVLTIANKQYLILVDKQTSGDTSKNILVKIELGDKISKPVTLAEDFTSAIFADKYSVSGDEFAYYLTANTDNKTGSLLTRINLLTGDKTLLNENQIRTIELKQVFNGKLFISYKDQVGNTELTNGTLAYILSTDPGFSPLSITNPTDTSLITGFKAMIGENNQEYYVLTTSSPTATYVLTSGIKELSESTKIISKNVNFLFTYNDYLYYSVSESGLFRISVRDNTKTEQQITDKTTIKTQGISFDGKYIYFFASNTEYTSGTYYMHRADVRVREGNASANFDVQMLSLILDQDKPDTEE